MSVQHPGGDAGTGLVADASRVVTRFFVPGKEDLGPGASRAGPVVDRILGLDEAEVETVVAELLARFAGRHRELEATFRDHASRVARLVDPGLTLSSARLLLLGASFTHEYSIEGAALCNPSAVVHPHQGTSDDLAFVVSVRGIGEGHRSTIGFRTGTLAADGAVMIDAPGPFPAIGEATDTLHHRVVFEAATGDTPDGRDNAALALGSLPALFSTADLEAGIGRLSRQAATRRGTESTIETLREISHRSYEVVFPAESHLSERVLWPQVDAESHGMEDARFVRFVPGAGPATYYATYTAFDGLHIAQHLLETTDFRRFVSSPLAGAAAVGKGLALFPRQIGGRFAALSRADRETNAVAFSDDLHWWPTSETIQVPKRSWELLQLGNCGPPIETEAGWLVLTHGVGPMRTYALGAILLDLDQPNRVLARSLEPIIVPGETNRDGYVPNVVYSCGGFAHGDLLVLPYGTADQAISITTMSIPLLLTSLAPNDG